MLIHLDVMETFVKDHMKREGLSFINCQKIYLSSMEMHLTDLMPYDGSSHIPSWSME